MCNVNQHKAFDLVLTAVNEVHRIIVFILGDIYTFLTIIIWYNTFDADNYYPIIFLFYWFIYLYDII